MNDDIYWLWLQKVLGEGAFFKDLIEMFGSAKDIYNAGLPELKMCPDISSKQLKRAETINIDDCTKTIYECKVNDWKIISYDNPQYPEKLKNIYNPPCVLFVDGDLPDLDSLCSVAVVGTRKASSYAVRATNMICQGVARAGAVTVSGGALGVDSAAHTGSILGGGKTVCVLGCGFGTNYLLSNEKLRQSIKSNGALVTEYQPFTPPTRYTFPMRNRIISGLSDGVLVVEAGIKSGSLITAKYASEQGRDVFAVPSSIVSAEYSGANKLLTDGAMIVTQPIDLISPYIEKYPYLNSENVPDIQQLLKNEKKKNANSSFDVNLKNEMSFENSDNEIEKGDERMKKISSLSKDLKDVYFNLTENYEYIDIISERCATPSNKVLSALSILEIQGLVSSASGKRYKKI